MAIPTSNNGTTFYNRNICRSFNQPLGTSLVALSAQVCSEVLLINKTGQSVKVFDSNYSGDSNHILLDSLDSMMLRGITDASQVSAQTTTGSGKLYYRTQYFSSTQAQ